MKERKGGGEEGGGRKGENKRGGGVREKERGRRELGSIYCCTCTQM